jgi:hypothetical protein
MLRGRIVRNSNDAKQERTKRGLVLDSWGVCEGVSGRTNKRINLQISKNDSENTEDTPFDTTVPVFV